MKNENFGTLGHYYFKEVGGKPVYFDGFQVPEYMDNNQSVAMKEFLSLSEWRIENGSLYMKNSEGKENKIRVGRWIVLDQYFEFNVMGSEITPYSTLTDEPLKFVEIAQAVKKQKDTDCLGVYVTTLFKEKVCLGYKVKPNFDYNKLPEVVKEFLDYCQIKVVGDKLYTDMEDAKNVPVETGEWVLRSAGTTAIAKSGFDKIAFKIKDVYTIEKINAAGKTYH